MARMDKQKGRGRFVCRSAWPRPCILFTVFMVIPTINVFRMSLYKWGGYSANQEFVGLDNFKKLFADPKFYQSFQNTILLIVIVTIIHICVRPGICVRSSRGKRSSGQNFFRVDLLHPEYPVGGRYQRHLQRHLRPEPRPAQQSSDRPVPWTTARRLR